ncbi:MAG: hypothetical protein V3U50_05350 [Acidimicrobiia bacterium]
MTRIRLVAGLAGAMLLIVACSSPAGEDASPPPTFDVELAAERMVACLLEYDFDVWIDQGGFRAEIPEAEVEVFDEASLLCNRQLEEEGIIPAPYFPQAPATSVIVTTVWPPPILDVEVPEGASWQCPPVESEIDKVLDAADVPSDIRFLPPVDAFRPDTVWGVNYGQACGRPPTLVAVEFADEQRSSVEAMIVVWVEVPSGHLDPPLDTPLADLPQPAVADMGGDTPGSITERDRFILRHRPANQFHKEWLDMIGVIDGLAVWIEASGLSPDDLGDYVNLMTASATTGQVGIDQPSERFEVVHSAAVVAETIDHVVWYVEGPGFDIEIKRQPGFDPYGSALSLVGADSLRFVPIGGSSGFVIREGGGTGYLTWAIRPGIVSTVLGDGTFEELTRFAELLAPAG